MAWIESHQSLSRHRKTLQAASELRVDRHKLLGHLHELWWWGLDNADIYGQLGHVPSQMLAQAAGWDVRRADQFVDALSAAGFLDRTDDGVVLHDWYEYAGKLNERREENRERMRKKRVGKPDPDGGGARTNGARATHVQRTSGARAPATGPNQPDQPNQTNNSVSEETASELGTISPGDDRVDAVYEHFRNRVQPKSRLCPRKKIAARLRKFTADEMREGIDHFADDPWWMEHNASRGAEWFFESDARAEQFLLMKPRAPGGNVVSLNRRPPARDNRPQVPSDSPFLNLKGVS